MLDENSLVNMVRCLERAQGNSWATVYSTNDFSPKFEVEDSISSLLKRIRFVLSTVRSVFAKDTIRYVRKSSAGISVEGLTELNTIDSSVTSYDRAKRRGSAKARQSRCSEDPP